MYLSLVDLSFRTLHPSTFFSTPIEFTYRQGNRHHHRSRLQQCHYCSPTLHVSATLLTISASLALREHVKPRLRLPTYPPIAPYIHTQRGRTCKDTTRTESSRACEPETRCPPVRSRGSLLESFRPVQHHVLASFHKTDGHKTDGPSVQWSTSRCIHVTVTANTSRH